MEQAIEVLKFSRLGLAATNNTKTGLIRVAGHVKSAYGSFRRTPKHPLSADAARKLVAVDRALDQVRAALDAAAVQLGEDAAYYRERVTLAEAAVAALEVER